MDVLLQGAKSEEKIWNLFLWFQEQILYVRIFSSCCYQFSNFILKVETQTPYTQNCWSLGQIKELMSTAIGFKSLLATELSWFFRIIFLILISLNFTIISHVTHFLHCARCIKNNCYSNKGMLAKLRPWERNLLLSSMPPWETCTLAAWLLCERTWEFSPQWLLKEANSRGSKMFFNQQSRAWHSLQERVAA